MRLFTFLLSLLSLITLAQDGINYQGVATNGSGAELINQNISIRASVISDSTNGTIQWQEIHSTTTDQFGLFNIIIGQGSSTGVGQTINFDNMNWGSGNHYLRIEMDATGGSNYTLISASQMMSVPYALYAKNAGIDSTVLTNMIVSSVGGMGGGCDFQFPDGLSGDFILIDILQGDYTVPTGKNLYILNAMTDAGYHIINLNGKRFIKYDNSYWKDNAETVMVGSGSTLSSQYLYPGSIQSSTIFGFLADKQVDFISIDILQGDYTVPTGKNLYILNAMTDAGYQIINLNGKRFIKYDNSYWKDNAETVMVGSGSTLSSQYLYPGSIQSSTMFGYLADEDYFADCGGGSSSSTIDSSYIDSLVQFYSSGIGGECNYQFPEGLYGDPITVNLNIPYIVPNNKNLYILRNENNIQVDGKNVHQTADQGNPYIANSAQIITSLYPNTMLNGVLINKSNDVSIIFHDLLNNNYTVPNGKTFYVLGSTATILIDGENIQVNGLPLILQAGKTISSPNNTSSRIVNGYLVDEDYFKNCGTGGNSSSVSAVDSAMVAAMIANAGLGGSFGTPITNIQQNINNFTEALEDGFVGGLINCGSQGGTFGVWDDTTSNSLYSYNESNIKSTFLIPVKKGQFWKSSNYCVNVSFFIPLESEVNSSLASGNMSVSTFGDTLTINGQSIIVPGISYPNTPSNIFGTVSDIDGNIYQTVNINGKEWMMENLKVLRFNNGDQIGHITGVNNWQSSICSSPGYISHPGVTLYNYHVVDDTRNVCPVGWSIPNNIDFENVLNVINNGEPAHNNTGTAYGKQWDHAGIALKSTSASTHGYSWTTSLTIQANNTSHLNFLRTQISSCNSANGYFTGDVSVWSATTAYGNDKWGIQIYDTENYVRFDNLSNQSYSHVIRCVKD